MKKIKIETTIGAAIALLGLVVMLGWLLMLPELVRIIPGAVAVRLNAAILFLAAGIWLVLRSFPDGRWRSCRIALAALLILLPTAILAEHAFDLDLGIDWPTLHALVQDGNLQPGRIAPNACIAFLLTGAIFLLVERMRANPRIMLLVRAMAAGVLLIGLSALFGYLLQLEWMYRWYKFNSMTLTAAIAFCALGAAAWRLGNANQDADQDARIRQSGQRITALSTGMLVVIALVAGLAGFAILRQSVEGVLKSDLMQTARDRSAYFEATIGQSIVMANMVAARPAVLSYLDKLNTETGDQNAAALLNESALSYLALGFSGVTFLGNHGKVLSRAGSLVQQAELTVPIRDKKDEVRLLWDRGFVLQTTVAIVVQKQHLGTVISERRLDGLTEVFAQTPGMGRSGEHKICARNQTLLDCFPSRLVPKIHHLPFFIDGQPSYPVARAILGQSGVVQVADFRGEKVLASYLPLGSSGLGLVVKMDTEEIYAPISTRFQYMLLLLVALVTAGAVMVHSWVKPLVSKLVASEQEARLQEERTRVIIDTAHDAFIGMDADGRITDWNSQAEVLFGWSRAEALGREMANLIIPPAARDAHRKGMQHYRKTGVGPVLGRRIELSALRRNGEEFPVELTINAIASGDSLRFSAFLHDITERKRAEQRLTHLAQYDGLTGLPNRMLFFDRLENAILRTGRTRKASALFFLDLDRFKAINDSFGHQTGDLLLQSFSERLIHVVRKTDSVARFAGDEFTIILEELADPASDTQTIASKIIQAMSVPFTLAGEKLLVTTSIGIALYLGEDMSADELIRRADTAMYLAKQKGRNGFCFYDASLDKDGEDIVGSAEPAVN